MKPHPPHPQRQHGETLVGLLVGIALGMLVLAAGTQMLAQLLRGYRQALQDSHLQQDLHFALDLMARELANAQYVAQAWKTRSVSACNDPFCDAANDFQISDNRIEFSLDRDHNGEQDNNECLGYRVANGVLSMRTSCDSSGCARSTVGAASAAPAAASSRDAPVSPSAATASTKQAVTGRPARITVQAPQSPVPQPSFEPVRFN